MSLNKQPVNINFSQGIDKKTDKNQLQVGKFAELNNSVFTKAGQLTKRNGFFPLSTLPVSDANFLTTFNGNLTALGDSLYAYSSASQSWVQKSLITPINLDTLPLIRSNLNQSQVDTAVSSNGLVCTVFTDDMPSSTTTTTPIYKYAIANSITGQNIVAPQVLPVVDGVPTGSMRVFVLGNYFVIVFSNLYGGTYKLQYMAIQINSPTVISVNRDISAQYTATTQVSFDGVVNNNRLYLSWRGASSANVRMAYLTSNLTLSAQIVVSGHAADFITLAADLDTDYIFVSFYENSTSSGYTFVVDADLAPILASTQSISTPLVLNLASTVQSGVCSLFYEVDNSYAYDTAIKTHFIQKSTISSSGVVTSAITITRDVGLASKAFLVGGMSYFLTIHNASLQPTYFFMNGDGKIMSRFAYQNAGVYYTKGLPSATVIDSKAYIGYFFKDLIQAVNKDTQISSVSGIYSQTGLNLASLVIGSDDLSTSEIGGNLNISGGFLRAYDGYSVVENGFFLYPEYLEVTPTTGGSMGLQQYYYQATYEWSDNQGNIFRSAPSIAIPVTLSGGNTAVTLHIPTLRLTYKTENPVKLVIYRWSVAQQNFYQVTSILIPLLNDTTIDYIDYTDKASDASILGNNLIYTTGGVIENVSPPATDIVTLFNNRLFLVDSEDPNLLWYSKQVIEATPVEMSDLLTIYVAPTTAAQGSTGPTTALAALDDKLILFKQNAIYYISGQGPDNTGANSQYSDATFITSTVGCTNQHSIVFIPSGLMFQSDKGIWLLGRDLSTNYIGAPAESLTLGAIVTSAVNVPATNEVRFTLDSGITLMYDYYFNQWGVFKNVTAKSSVIYDKLHTYLNSQGKVLQETPGRYLDDSSPVLLSFTTGWLNLAGLQGYERFYSMFLLGEYITPFKLNIQIGYDYNSSAQQSTIVTPKTPGKAWGGEQLWGSGEVYGGPSSVFEARVFPTKQKCESFQITVSESYDPTLGIAAGAGLTLSGMDLVVGLKKGYRTSSSGRSFGK